MKTLSTALLAEQKKATAMPALSLVARQYGHPAKAALIQPGMFGWTMLYSDAKTPYYHGLAIPGDGSLIRARYTVGTGVQVQRTANPSPSSDFDTAWTTVLSTGIAPCAIASLGAEVSVFGSVFGGPPKTIEHNQSDDNGVTWNGQVTAFPGYAGAKALACAYDGSGNLCVVGSDSGAANLWACVRVGGVWGSIYVKASPPLVETLTMYFDGDWNIIALVIVTDATTGLSYFKLARIIFGWGYQLSAYTWGGTSYLDTAGKATVDSKQLMSQYYRRPYRERAYLPPSPRQPRHQRNPWTHYNRYEWYVKTKLPIESHSRMAPGDNWESVSTIVAARAIDNLDLDAPFICKPAGHPPILSAIKIAQRWFFRLRPGGAYNTFFALDEWSKAHVESGSCTYGLALASDGTYLWGTRINEVWRSRLPGTCWNTPAIGTGPNANSQTIPQDDILDMVETVRPFDVSELEVILDNSKATYSSLPSTHIKRGSQVELAIGYRAPTDELSPVNKYFIEDYVYDRDANEATVSLYCIDAWGLLEQYVIPAYQEYNLASDTHSVYDLIGKLMACIGGTLTYTSRSTAITATYPKLEIQAGETGAALLVRLLELVPDVIYFNGLTAYIVYPQTSDTPVYSYQFPEES